MCSSITRYIAIARRISSSSSSSLKVKLIAPIPYSYHRPLDALGLQASRARVERAGSLAQAPSLSLSCCLLARSRQPLVVRSRWCLCIASQSHPRSPRPRSLRALRMRRVASVVASSLVVVFSRSPSLSLRRATYSYTRAMASSSSSSTSSPAPDTFPAPPPGYQVQREGAAAILFRENEKEVFYNPAMVTNRDLSVAMMRVYIDKLADEQAAAAASGAKPRRAAKPDTPLPTDPPGIRVLEALAASGSCRVVLVVIVSVASRVLTRARCARPALDSLRKGNRTRRRHHRRQRPRCHCRRGHPSKPRVQLTVHEPSTSATGRCDYGHVSEPRSSLRCRGPRPLRRTHLVHRRCRASCQRRR